MNMSNSDTICLYPVRGWGWLTNPRKAAYNRINNRTTIDMFALGRSRRSRGAGCLRMLALAGLAAAGVGGDNVNESGRNMGASGSAPFKLKKGDYRWANVIHPRQE